MIFQFSPHSLTVRPGNQLEIKFKFELHFNSVKMSFTLVVRVRTLSRSDKLCANGIADWSVSIASESLFSRMNGDLMRLYQHAFHRAAHTNSDCRLAHFPINCFSIANYVRSLSHTSNLLFCRETSMSTSNYGSTSSSKSAGTKKRRTSSVIYCVHGKVAFDCCDVDASVEVKKIQPTDCEYISTIHEKKKNY